MKHVILGLKHKETKQLKVYNPDSHRKAGIHVDVVFGSPMTLPVFSPFPFETFSSLDYGKDVFRTFDPTYLMVEAELSKEQEKGLKSSGILYHRFMDHPVTVLAEFHEPFSYALDSLNRYGKRLGTYDLTTWLIHEETRSAKEYEAMCEILKRALADKENKQYGLDLSLDRYVLPYVDFLKDQGGRKLTFGWYGHISLTPADMRDIPLSLDGFLFLLEHSRFTDAFFHYPLYDAAFHDRHIKDKPYESNILHHLFRDQIIAVAQTGMDMDYLFARCHDMYMKAYPDAEPYETNRELVTAADYQVVTKTHDPYEYYCCEDCDGYSLDSDDVPYDYEVDEQVASLEELLEGWDTVLTEKSVSLFSEWQPAIFERYVAEHPDSRFGHLLTRHFSIKKETSAG